LSSFQEAKLWLVDNSGLTKDALHVYVSLTLFFGSALLFRWRLSGWRPWLVVAVAAIAGELWDIRDTLSYGGHIAWAEGRRDLINTLFWPSVILILARYTHLFPQPFDEIRE